MSLLHNLVVELGSQWDEPAHIAAMRRIEAMGLHVELRRGADDRTLAWIDDEFGGVWSTEVFHGTNFIVRKGDVPVGFVTIESRYLKFHWLRGAATEKGTGLFGPFGIDPGYRGMGLGDALITLAMCELHDRGYSRALIAAVGDNHLILYYLQHAKAQVTETFDLFKRRQKNARAIVMASGSGTNFQRVIDRTREGSMPIELVGMVTNHPKAYARERATRAGVPHIIVPWDRKDVARSEYDATLLDVVEKFKPDLILLLGWMHLLAPSFVERFSDILNIHPAFLPLDPSKDEVGMPDGSVIPAFRGPRAVQDAIAAESTWVGASFHRVTNDTDRGEVLARVPLNIEAFDGDEDLVFGRLHPIEHDVVERGIRRWLFER